MATTHPPYPPAFRAEAVELVRTGGKSIPRLASELGVSEQALRGWLKRAEGDAGRGQPGELTTAEREGWLYLAVLLDAHSRRVVGWAMADHLRAELALDALAMALGNRRPATGLVHHTDRGGQYTAAAYRAALAAHGVTASMSRAGECLDNALAESFFATLKAELADAHGWPTRAAARQAILEWIEVWYKRQRRHSALGYQSPIAWEGEVLLLSKPA